MENKQLQMPQHVIEIDFHQYNTDSQALIT